MSTKIEWTTETWNPVTGGTQLSAGCANCYAKTIALQMQKNGVRKYVNGFTVTMHEYALNMPRLLREPSFIFVCSMADLFHKDVPFEFIDKVMAVIRSTPQHTYQILTKRAERMAEYFTARAIPANVWLGVSVEASDVKHRIDSVRNLPASIRFLSCEPLVEDLGELDLTNINWVIVGGEHAVNARPMKEPWVLSIKDQTEKQGALFFFKQWGSIGRDGVYRSVERNGSQLQGKTYKAMPVVNRHTLFG